MAELKIITPPVASLPLDHILVAITEEIDKHAPETVAHGALGGSHGYGAHWDSPVFMMHPFCWCELDTCLWCGGCDCPDGAHHYFVDGQEVPYREYSDFFERETYAKLSGGKFKRHSDKGADKFFHSNSDAWFAAADVANKRRTSTHDPVCDFCARKGMWACEMVIPNREGAPNFWHKPSGLRVWWYKWIGRGMKSHGPQSDLASMLNECLADIRSRTAPARTSP